MFGLASTLGRRSLDIDVFLRRCTFRKDPCLSESDAGQIKRMHVMITLVGRKPGGNFIRINRLIIAVVGVFVILFGESFSTLIVFRGFRILVITVRADMRQGPSILSLRWRDSPRASISRALPINLGYRGGNRIRKDDRPRLLIIMLYSQASTSSLLSQFFSPDRFLSFAFSRPS